MAEFPRADDPDAFDGTSVVEELVDHLRWAHGFDDDAIDAFLALDEVIATIGSQLLERSLDFVEEARGDDGVIDLDAAEFPSGQYERWLAEVAESVLGDDPDVGSALGLLLGDQRWTVAVLHDCVGIEHLLAMITLALLVMCEPELDRPARANRQWLVARLLEFEVSDHTTVERALRQTLDLDPHHGEAVFDLARYRADRGEAGATLGLLRQLEDSGGDRGWVELLERYAAPGPTSAGRNDPCPCGSGRKHKVCCAPRNGWPLEERMPWIYDKLVRHATSAPVADLLSGVLDLLGTGERDPDA